MNEYAKGEADCNKGNRKKYEYPAFFDGDQPLSKRSGCRSKRTMQDVFLWNKNLLIVPGRGLLIFFENFCGNNHYTI